MYARGEAVIMFRPLPAVPAAQFQNIIILLNGILGKSQLNQPCLSTLYFSWMEIRLSRCWAVAYWRATIFGLLMLPISVPFDAAQRAVSVQIPSEQHHGGEGSQRGGFTP